ncbi:flap endonuclease-1 [Rhodotorula toruloides]|uniref:Exonuclease 1 n=1 Tax=Rhodotorula toruloides TaxID=5286 RepID=A0A511KA33_RHOTO|nr:flap endonuclease-1 [Rhodotorula toruloides]
MGVKDLIGLAKKLAPSSITIVPNWTTFAGRKVAIDASLLTNRFHFGRPRLDEIGEDVVDGRHHARSWYRFLQTLKMYGVEPLVVFDGSTRLAAKAREVQRRRKVYNLVKARAKVEADRSDRLKEMKEVWDNVGAEERPNVLAQLKEAVERVEKERRLRIEAEAQAVTAAAPPPDAETLRAADALASDLLRLELELEGGLAPSAATSTASSTTSAPPSAPSIPASPAEPAPVASEEVRPPTIETPPPPVKVAPSVPAPPPASTTPPTPLTPLIAEQPSIASLFDHLEEGPVKALAQLHEAQVADAGAVIYSKRQRSVALDQNALFGVLMKTEEPKPAVTEKLAEVVEGITPEEGMFEASWPDLDESAEVETGLGNLVARSASLAIDYKHNAFSVPPAALQKTRELVQAMGVPWLQPGPKNPFEAEGVCSALYKAGLIDCVVSEDTDVAVFGAPLLRYATMTENPKNAMNVLDPVELRKQLDMTKEQLVDLAILLGTDFTARIPGLGPVTVIELMRQHGSIEAIVDVLANEGYKRRKYTPVEGDFDAYLETVRIAREIYLNLPSMPPSEPIVTPPVGAPVFDKRPVDSDDASTEPPAWYGDLDPQPAPDLDDILARFGITPGETYEWVDALERYAIAQMEKPAHDDAPDELALEAATFEAEFERTAEVPDEPTAPSEMYAEGEAVIAEVEQLVEAPDEPAVLREMDPELGAELGALYAEIGQVAVGEPADYEETARRGRGRGRKRRGTMRA